MTCTESLKKVVQIGIVVDDIEDAVEKWCTVLGVEKPKIIETDVWEKTRAIYRGEPVGRAKLAFIELENIVIELIEPTEGESIWKTHLKRYGQGIHHIAFKTENLEECLERLKNAGSVEQYGYFENGMYVYVDAQRSLGAVIEFLRFFDA